MVMVEEVADRTGARGHYADGFAVPSRPVQPFPLLPPSLQGVYLDEI